MRKIAELFFIYFLAPLVIWADIDYRLKISYFIVGFIYVIWVTVKEEKIEWKIERRLKTRGLLVPIILRFVFILISTLIIIYYYQTHKLFDVVQSKPLVWMGFSLVYIIASVVPQEFLYRTFFFSRYKSLFSNKWVFMAANCVLFSFAHIWLDSWLVLGFTLVGGILYFLTYRRTNSLFFVCIEHAAYGIWLYTVGFGELFNFPV